LLPSAQHLPAQLSSYDAQIERIETKHTVVFSKKAFKTDIILISCAKLILLSKGSL
jgi:hypothetical protein